MAFLLQNVSLHSLFAVGAVSAPLVLNRYVLALRLWVGLEGRVHAFGAEVEVPARSVSIGSLHLLQELVLLAAGVVECLPVFFVSELCKLDLVWNDGVILLPWWRQLTSLLAFSLLFFCFYLIRPQLQVEPLGMLLPHSCWPKYAIEPLRILLDRRRRLHEVVYANR